MRTLALFVFFFVMQIKGGYCQEIVGYINQPTTSYVEVVEQKVFVAESRRLVPVVSNVLVPVIRPNPVVVYQYPVYYAQPVIYAGPFVMQKKSCLWGPVRY